jgi:hypothetical protein
VDVPKDELTHETYWTHMRFEDPCTEEDRKEFALCNHFCRSEEHNKIDGPGMLDWDSLYDCKAGTISFGTQCYSPFDEQIFSSNLFLLFLTCKTCYLCNALKLSCYVDKAVKISLFSFTFPDLFLSTLFSVSE